MKSSIGRLICTRNALSDLQNGIDAFVLDKEIQAAKRIKYFIRPRWKSAERYRYLVPIRECSEYFISRLSNFSLWNSVIHIFVDSLLPNETYISTVTEKLFNSSDNIVESRFKPTLKDFTFFNNSRERRRR